MAQATTATVTARAEGWIGDFEGALRRGDVAALTDLLLVESYWRDLVALTWDVRQYWGRADVVRRLLEYAATAEPRGLRIAPDRTPPRVLDDGFTADFFFSFETATGTGSALVIAVLDDTARWGMRARLVATSLTGLHSHPTTRPTRRGFVPARSGETWLQHRRRVKDATDREPDVLVLGGGQSGLAMGARLDRHGVSYVVVDKEARPGDGWRKRYSSLALHTPTCVNDLPYVRQPNTFPGFLSKDQWADYLDAYATFMDLNWWGSTEFVRGTFDEVDRVWTVELRRPDGSTHVMRPKHLVAALGYTGTEPLIPDLPGLADFAGEVVHSSKFVTGEAHRGQRVMVIGTGTSGHDIALDLCENGATAFMGQRGPACVVPINEAERYNVDYLDHRLSIDEIDQRRNSGFVYPLLVKRSQVETARTEQEYAQMFDGLRRAGMRLTIGEDRTGWLMKLHRTFNGYYLDVGASQAVIDGRITVIQLADVETFVPEGARLVDGTVVPLDVIVLATGYQNNRATIERLLGGDVADRIGRVGGIGEDGEHRNLARPTGQPHLWLLFGGIMDARKMSDLLALQIIAQIEGVVPTLVRAEDGGLRALESAAVSAGATP